MLTWIFTTRFHSFSIASRFNLAMFTYIKGYLIANGLFILLPLLLTIPTIHSLAAAPLNDSRLVVIVYMRLVLKYQLVLLRVLEVENFA